MKRCLALLLLFGGSHLLVGRPDIPFMANDERQPDLGCEGPDAEISPVASVRNVDGIPSSPFRTDDFQLIAAEKPEAAKVLPEGTMSFEGSAAGEFRELRLKEGRWIAAAGHAEITDKFAQSGRKSLHIFGGEERQIEFVPTALDKAGGTLSFRAERWTKRDPFSFRIDALIGNNWQEIYRGDREIRVGARFLSQVSTQVPGKTTRIRMTCTSPAQSGILIDDVRLRPAKKMEVTVSQEWPVVPALIGKKDNPLVQIHLDADGSLEPQTVTVVELSTAGTDSLEDLKAVRLLINGKPFGKIASVADRLGFEGRLVLKEGRNTITAMVALTQNASLDRRVKLSCTRVNIGGVVRELEDSPAKTGRQRVGVALRQRGDDKSGAYRIPGLATTNKGTVIAVYDIRYGGGGDLPGDIDVGMSRSTDGGQSWEPMKVIMDMGREKKWHFDGIGDSAVLVDRVSNTIWVAATWSHGNRSWRGSGPGMTPEETGQLMLVKSEDDGRTWSKPINITRQVKDPKWRFVLQGPGKGITLQDGTLVFAAQYRGENAVPVSGKPFSTLIYSKDRGKTWKIGSGVKIDTTEAQLVELGDGSIMINCRDNRGGSRSVYTTKDLGATWRVHPTSRKALREPVCMASLIRVEHPKHGNLLVFSNPNTSTGRKNMTLKVSNDEGLTWPKNRHTLYDSRGGSGYSCLTVVDGDKIGVLYEGPVEIYYLRLPIEELLS